MSHRFGGGPFQGSSSGSSNSNGGHSSASEAGPSSSNSNGHRSSGHYQATRFSNGASNGDGGAGGGGDAGGSSGSSKGSALSSAGSNGHSAAAQAESADYTGFKAIYEGSKVDRKELVRLTLQTLKELGYESSAKTLESEAGITLEHPSITAFRSAVLSGDWRNAERLLVDGLTYAAVRRATPRSAANGWSNAPDLDSVLRDPKARSMDSVKFLLHQQRYLELLEAGHTKKALSVLRERLTPLSHGSDELHLLSSLVMCSGIDELRLRAGWAGIGPQSRRALLEEIEQSISPAVMLSSRRLPHLLEQAQTLQKQLDPFFNLPTDAHVSLYTDHRSDRSIFPSQTTHILRGHDDEVWVMAFSHDGRYLATGSKDKTVIIWSVSTDRCEKVKTLGPHSAEVTSIAWSPDDSTVLSTSDTDVYLWKWSQPGNHNILHGSHKYAIYAAAWLPTGEGFVTGGTDGQIKFWDRMGNMTHSWQTSPFRILALAITPDGSHLVAVSWRPGNSHLHHTSSASDRLGLGSSSGVDRSSLSTTSSSHRSFSTSESPSPVSTSGHYAEAPTHRSRRFDDEDDEDEGQSLHGLGDARSKIHFYDLQKKQELAPAYMVQEMNSVCVSDDSRYALINQRPNESQLWDIQQRCLVSSYTGHRITRDMIRCCFGGSEESFVASGSEDSCIYIYHRTTGKLLDRLVGHGPGSVNTVCWHPKMPSMLASCGDDRTVRIWQPSMPKTRRKSVLDKSDEREASMMAASSGEWSSGVNNGMLSAPRRNGLLDEAEDEGSGVMPFPWSMSPARASSPVVEGEGEGEGDGVEAAGDGVDPTTSEVAARFAESLAEGGDPSSSMALG